MAGIILPQMKHSCYCVGLTLLVLFGCTKAKEEFSPFLSGSLAGEYRAGSSILAPTPIAMYTSTGEIKNVTVIDDYLRRYYRRTTSFPVYFSRTDVAVANGVSHVLTINANDQVVEVSTFSTGSTTFKSNLVLRTPDYLVLKGTDSVTFATGSNVLTSPCAPLGKLARTLNPVERCQQLPASTGYQSICKFLPLQAITIRNGELYIPVLSVLLETRVTPSNAFPASKCGYRIGNERNVFDTTFLNRLAPGDTLVVQAREIAWIRK